VGRSLLILAPGASQKESSIFETYFLHANCQEDITLAANAWYYPGQPGHRASGHQTANVHAFKFQPSRDLVPTTVRGIPPPSRPAHIATGWHQTTWFTVIGSVVVLVANLFTIMHLDNICLLSVCFDFYLI
jgi:hypothetical protein